jgi:hypothetical protein
MGFVSTPSWRGTRITVRLFCGRGRISDSLAVLENPTPPLFYSRPADKARSTRERRWEESEGIIQ